MKDFLKKGNVLSSIITLVLAAIAFHGGNVAPDAAGNLVNAISSHQVFAIVTAIAVNILTPLAYIFVKRPVNEPWWGFLRSRNFGINLLNLLFLGIASLGYTVPSNVAPDVWNAIEGQDWGALVAVLATTGWGLVTSFFKMKAEKEIPVEVQKTRNGAAAAPPVWVPKIVDSDEG